MANLNIKEIVEWMIEKAKDKASDSIAVIDEGEIVKEFGVEPGWLQSHGPGNLSRVRSALRSFGLFDLHWKRWRLLVYSAYH